MTDSDIESPEVITVSLQDFLRDFSHVYEPAGWDHLIAHFQESDHADWETICLLEAELKSAAFFRRPICVDEEERFVLDGTHRVLAYLKNNSYLIQYYLRGQEEDPFEDMVEDDGVTTQVRFPESCTEEQIDSIYGIVRSLKVDRRTWITSSFSTMDQSLNQVNIFWDDPQNIDFSIITEKTKEKLLSYGYEVEVETLLERI